jgi:thioredoxin reductase (NADPH)
VSTSPERDLGALRDITIVGAGPVGLATAFWAGMREASARIVESLPELGGQCTALYPEKWIFDVPGHPRLRARELVERLREQALGQFDVPVHLATTARSFAFEDGIATLETDAGPLRSRAVIVAGGHGAFEPRKLPASDADASPWEGRGVHYVISDPARLAGQRVVIVGGGDSALDWVLNLAGVAAHVTLVHRRERWRAHEVTVAAVMREVEAGRVDLRVPRVVAAIEGTEHLEAVELRPAGGAEGEPERIACDALLPQLGFITKLGPLEHWGLELHKGSIVVDPQMRTSLEGVWACGDVATFDGKLKLIATGFGEAATAVAGAVRSFRPQERLQPGYSTNTGVPGSIAGQP